MDGKGTISPTVMSRRDKRNRDHEAEDERGVEVGLEDLSLEGRGREAAESDVSCRISKRGEEAFQA